VEALGSDISLNLTDSTVQTELHVMHFGRLSGFLIMDRELSGNYPASSLLRLKAAVIKFNGHGF
jgi:hypothetical protein